MVSNATAPGPAVLAPHQPETVGPIRRAALADAVVGRPHRDRRRLGHRRPRRRRRADPELPLPRLTVRRPEAHDGRRVAARHLFERVDLPLGAQVPGNRDGLAVRGQRPRQPPVEVGGHDHRENPRLPPRQEMGGLPPVGGTGIEAVARADGHVEVLVVVPVEVAEHEAAGGVPSGFRYHPSNDGDTLCPRTWGMGASTRTSWAAAPGAAMTSSRAAKPPPRRRIPARTELFTVAASLNQDPSRVNAPSARVASRREARATSRAGRFPSTPGAARGSRRGGSRRRPSDGTVSCRRPKRRGSRGVGPGGGP